MPNLPPKLSAHALQRFLPEMLQSSVSGAQFEHSLARPGLFDGNLLHCSFDGFKFDAGSYSRSVYCRGAMPHDAVTVGLGAARNAGGLFNGSEITSATPVVYTEGAVLDTKLTPHTQWFGFQVPRALLLEAGVNVPDGQAGTVGFDPQRLMELSHVLRASLQLFAGLAAENRPNKSHAAQIRAQLEGLFAVFAGCLYPESKPTSRDRPVVQLKAVATAREYIDANFREVIRVGELCELTCLSYRRLERAFNSVLGMPPKRYITAVRLSCARKKLLQLQQSHAEKTQVTDIAMECGCFHLGRFAHEYRMMFGESPSQTLKMKAK